MTFCEREEQRLYAAGQRCKAATAKLAEQFAGNFGDMFALIARNL